MDNFKVFKIHTSYIIGFLIVVIIALITTNWNNIPNLVDYITFALTLSSLVLSLLAIVYSFISNSKFSESIGALNNVSDEVLSSTQKLNSITDDLKVKVAEIPEHLRNVEEKTEKTHQLIESMQKDKENKLVSTPEISELADSSINNYLLNSSFNGKALLYALKLSYEQKKSFQFNELFEDNIDYMYGFFIASSVIGLFDFTEDEKIITINTINQIILNKIKDVAYESAEKYDKDQKPEDLIRFSWVAKLNLIEKYFTNK